MDRDVINTPNDKNIFRKIICSAHQEENPELSAVMLPKKPRVDEQLSNEHARNQDFANGGLEPKV